MNHTLFASSRQIDFLPFPARTANRKAFTLIEMLVVISLMSVMMAAMGLLLHGAWRVQRSMDEHRVSMNALERLAAQFRSDVHSANSASVGVTASDSSKINSAVAANANQPDAALGQAPSSLQSFMLTLPGGKQIEYQTAEGSNTVHRIIRSGTAVVAREDYVLPEGATIQWKISTSDPKRQQSPWEASLLVSYPLSNRLPEFAERRQLRIDAVAGLQNSEIRIAKSNPQ